MRKIRRWLTAFIELLLLPMVIVAAILLKGVRVFGIGRLPLVKKVLVRIGVFPVVDHYYEPLFNARHLRSPLAADRHLPGINWNIQEQLQLLERLNFSHELVSDAAHHPDELAFYFNNGNFESGDAEYWYNLIRLKKPRRIIEIGSGHSTKLARLAIVRNTREDADYVCEHVCIEPYEMPWLEQLGAKVVRKPVEEVKADFFNVLEADDFLFIDSSHVIRPQGDVLYEYLEILPSLRRGVIVHIHDIFTPKDYLASWILQDVRFWNEQYLLEAFLTENRSWRIIGALNLLKHQYFEKLKEKCPMLTEERQPGSFYIVKD